MVTRKFYQMRKKKRVNYVNYSAGEVVFEEGSDGKDIYFILNGEAEVSQHIAGRKEVIDILKDGDFFGEMAALSNKHRSMTVTAVGELGLHKLSLDEMLEHMRRDPKLLKNVLTNLARRLHDANIRISELIVSTIASRRNP